MGEKAEEGGGDLRCLLPIGRTPSWQHVQAAIMRVFKTTDNSKPRAAGVGIGGGKS